MVDIVASLVPGTHARLVTVSARVDPASIPEDADFDPARHVVMHPEGVVSGFLRAVDAGCFDEGGAEAAAAVIEAPDRALDGAHVEAWKLSFPALLSGAFSTLLAQMRTSAVFRSGVVACTLTEVARPDLPRIGAAELEPLRPATPPFEVNRPSQPDEESVLRITFEHPVRDDVLVLAREAIAAWAGVLTGGFSPWSVGFVGPVERQLPNEIASTLTAFSGEPEAVDALLRALAAVHRRAPILHVDLG